MIIRILIGPTSIGKSKLAKYIFGSKYINVDSKIVYKNINIVTAKSNNDNLLVNICSLYEQYSLLDFIFYFFFIIDKKYMFPVVGGNMMYINNLISIFRLSFCHIDFRDKNFINYYIAKNSEKIYNTDVKNYYLHSRIFLESSINFLQIALITNKKCNLTFYISNRVKNMLDTNMLFETSIFKKKYNDFQSFNSIGLYESTKYINNLINFKLFINSINSSTINLAKKQKTWLKKFGSNIIFLETEKWKEIYK